MSATLAQTTQPQPAPHTSIPFTPGTLDVLIWLLVGVGTFLGKDVWTHYIKKDDKESAMLSEQIERNYSLMERLLERGEQSQNALLADIKDVQSKTRVDLTEVRQAVQSLVGVVSEDVKSNATNMSIMQTAILEKLHVISQSLKSVEASQAKLLEELTDVRNRCEV